MLFPYNHSVGNCIIGGCVYRGKKVPELFGAYLFADHVTGQVFLRRRLVFERRVLQVFAHRHHAAQHAQKTFVVQSPGSEIHTRVQSAKFKVQSAKSLASRS